MKDILENIGGIILFYGVIILMLFLFNARFVYLNNLNNNSSVEELAYNK
jgi:hypothetical protein